MFVITSGGCFDCYMMKLTSPFFYTPRNLCEESFILQYLFAIHAYTKSICTKNFSFHS